MTYKIKIVSRAVSVEARDKFHVKYGRMYFDTKQEAKKYCIPRFDKDEYGRYFWDFSLHIWSDSERYEIEIFEY